MIFLPKDVEPFECEEFVNYFKNTYYFLNQVLAQSFEMRIATNLLVMTMDIQAHNWNISFVYVTYVAKQMHENFISLKKGILPLHFPHYSLLMHMLLFEGDYGWKRKLKLRLRDNENNVFPIISCFPML